jgi:hypothetical protein
MRNQDKLINVCSDVKRTRIDSPIAMCLPYIILTVALSINGTDAISGSLDEPEGGVDPDHPP